MHAVLTPECEAKVWGRTRCVHHSDHCLVFHASIDPGTWCSQHYHAHRQNDFYVVSGALLVHFYLTREAQVPYRTLTLHAGEKCEVRPGDWHRFEALAEPVELIETYWLRIDMGDIVRRDFGGRPVAR